MKFGGVSYNTNAGSKKGVKSSCKCSVCNRVYKMEWAKNNHERLCREKNEKDSKMQKM